MQSNLLYERSTTPPNRHGYFPRPRVDRLLAEAIEYPLVTVVAGAGWGKTLAVSAFLNRTDCCVAWRRMSQLDNLTVRFWESFVYAIDAHNPKLAALLTLIGFPSTVPLFHNFLHLWVEQTEETKRFILVFDDFHQVSEPAILHFIENLLSARLKNLTVILIGRTLPNLDSHNFCTDDSIYRITESDLRFSRDEIAEYYAARGFSLSDEELTHVLHKTEGWISAIYLIGLSMQKGGLDTSDALVIAERQIFELIRQEIFSSYSEELQQVLIRLACFDNISIDIIQEYSDYSLNLLDEIESKNQFIRFNPVTRTYDIHHLFLKFLLEKQARLPDDTLREMHAKIAGWHHAHGALIDALAHYRKCGNHEKIWEIISGYEIAIPLDIADLFLSLLAGFPASFAAARPLTRVVHARLLLNNGRLEESRRAFLDIVDTFETPPRTSAKNAVAGEAYLFLGMISMLSFDYKFTEYFQKAAAYLPHGSTLIDRRLNFSDGNYMLLIRDSDPGEVQRFVDAVMEAMPYGVQAMNGAAYGVKHVTKAEAAYYTNDMSEAEASAYKAIYQAEQNAQYDIVCAAYFVLLRVYFRAGKSDRVKLCFAKLNEILDNPQKATHANHCILTRDIMRGWYFARLDKADCIPEWILRSDQRARILSPNNSGRDQFIRAYCLLQEENYTELSALLEMLNQYYEVRKLLLARLEVRIYQSIVAQKTGDLPRSMAALREAYDLAVDNGLTMQFIEMGKYIRAVIYAARQSEYNTVPLEWLGEIYTKAITYEKQLNHMCAQYVQATGVSDEPGARLTHAEREILHHLSHGLTINEIAASLYISTSSTKKRLNSVYSKLGATNRADAVRIATKLGL